MGLMGKVTDDYVEFADTQTDADFRNSFFWRLALHELPLGVDPADSRVVQVLSRIRKACEDAPVVGNSRKSRADAS